MLRGDRRTDQGRRPSRGGVRVRVQQWAFGGLYGPGARWYDRFTRWLFLGEWQRWQEIVLSDLPGRGLVVEVGCGTGRLASVASSAARPWLATDRSPSMLAAARKRGRPAGPWFVRADAARLPLATGTAIAIVSTFPSRYIVRPEVGAELARVLAPGAGLVVVLSAELAASGLRRRLRRWALRRFYGGSSNLEATFAVPGFAGNVTTERSRWGTATVYRGGPA